MKAFTITAIIIVIIGLLAFILNSIPAKEFQNKNIALFTTAFPEAVEWTPIPVQNMKFYKLTAAISPEEFSKRLKHSTGTSVEFSMIAGLEFGDLSRQVEHYDFAKSIEVNRSIFGIITKEHPDSEFYIVGIAYYAEIIPQR